ncbi:MAG: hypothetical protein IJY67_02055 [Paludibacteraceae bacterium]|nr:hypothetical protein [Paludibacteraceae bacterium]
MDRFQNKYRISSARADWHDYDYGIYFVTICTADCRCYFGQIIDSQMRFSNLGQYAVEQFQNVQLHYSYAEIPLFVVMPNHIHAVVIFNDTPPKNNALTQPCRDGVHTVSTDVRSNRWKSEVVDERMQKVSDAKGRLSVVVGGLKRAITCYANKNAMSFKWQSRFYDRIVRDQDELNRIAEYIENNVINWHLDRLNIETK